MTKSVTVFAPASVANVAVGFDILGFAFDAVGDTVTVSLDDIVGVRVESIAAEPGVTIGSIPSDPARNTATAGLIPFLRDHGAKAGARGLSVRIRKGISMSSGMGGSAASAVGALVAANELLGTGLSPPELARYSLEGEHAASHAYHGDNIAPCLFGGMVLVRSLEPVDVVAIPFPGTVECVLIHPHLEVSTRHARSILKDNVPLKTFIEQSANLAGFLCACHGSDTSLLGRSLRDVLIEPQRAALIPGFAAAKAAALEAGALGFSISGSGPSVFALVKHGPGTRSVEKAVTEAFGAAGVTVDSWRGPISRQGARVV